MRNWYKEFEDRFGGTKYENNRDMYSLFRKTEYYEEYERFIEIVVDNNLELSQSPYSESYYAFEKGEKITWGYKPEGSYRMSNHWDFDGHCPKAVKEKYNRLQICKFVEGLYYEV